MKKNLVQQITEYLLLNSSVLMLKYAKLYMFKHAMYVIYIVKRLL